jgi:hypothetical protein
MYRLCRFFISDITAGENLLQNAYVPILRENERPDHGVLFAANGTCKTTLLSFVLSVFCPDQRRFVQHLQSGGDKTLEQYLIPGRPAVVVLDLASLTEPTLFEAEPEEHLVLGQLLYRHRSAADKVDRIYFIAHSLDLFGRLRENWEMLLDRQHPWQAVRDFAAPHIQQTTNQKEWADSLERLGLDPWLMDRQIDFARSEGGIKDAFKFRSEEEFLNFFLGCVTDMEAALTLRDTIGKSLRKMEDRPRKIAQLRAARDLEERIVTFDEMAAQWRAARDRLQLAHATLGEAAHLFAQMDEAAQGKLRSIQTDLEEADRQRLAAQSRKEIVRANASAVQRFQRRQQITRAKGEIEKIEAERQAFRREENALRSADLIAVIRRTRAEEEIRRGALLDANEALSPLVHRVDGLAQQYHLRLDEEKQRIAVEIDGSKERIANQTSDLSASEARRADLSEQLGALEEKILQNTNRIHAAEESRRALPMQPGERPENARDRLREEIRTREERICAAVGRLSGFDEELQVGARRWRQLLHRRSETQVQRDQLAERIKNEADQRARLLKSAYLQRVAGTPTFEPTAAELVTRFDDAIARSRDRLKEKQKQRLDMELELERLAGTETLATDAQTRRLVAYYHDQGISPGALKCFSEYLAGLYESPAEIARFLDSDPGRFTGIMAATEEVIMAVAERPVPAWLHRPVIVSTPCAPDDLTAVTQRVIRPKDPGVYTKQYLEKIRTRLHERLEHLETEIGEHSEDLGKMESDSRDLHAYRAAFPDAAAVNAMADRARKLDHALTALAAEITESETGSEALNEKKAAHEETRKTLAVEVTRLEEHLKLVESWLSRYQALKRWKRDGEKMVTMKKALCARIAAEQATIRQTREEIADLKGGVRENRAQLRALDEKSGDVPKPEGDTLSGEDRKTALAMDIVTLRGLFEEARERQRHKADELGVKALQGELDTLGKAIARRQARLDALRREHPHDSALAEAWAARSATDREERRVALDGYMEKHTGKASNLDTSIRFWNQGIERLNLELNGWARKGIQPDLSAEDLDGQDLDGVTDRLQREEARHAESHERLRLRCQELTSDLKRHQEWREQTRLGRAETRTFTPVWDKDSPRAPWPDMLDAVTVTDTIAAVKVLREQVDERLSAQKEELETEDNARRRMSAGFDRLQADIQSESFSNYLPAVIDQLRRHDSESLGAQAVDLIQRCGEIARNIESDLEISQRIMENLIEMLLSRGKEYHQKLQAAAQVTLPEEVFIFGGRSILRTGTRLDFAGHGEDFRRSVENWLHELIQQHRLPEVNQRVGNCLGAELLYQLLGASTGRKVFGVRLLKCDDTGRNYEPVGKDLGSGGEALTTAVLLYTLLISMRKKRRHRPDAHIPAFLILDNPLGVCNRSDFLDAQLKVARAMGIQCVYMTGINDRESLDLFELRVAITKGAKKLEIDRTAYNLLEITELNVERGHGAILA